MSTLLVINDETIYYLDDVVPPNRTNQACGTVLSRELDHLYSMDPLLHYFWHVFVCRWHRVRYRYKAVIRLHAS